MKSLAMDNVAAQGTFDYVALIFATVMVTLAVNQELKDVELVSIAVRQAGDKLSRGWRIALMLLNGTRRWVFLPTLLQGVPLLVVLEGGESLPFFWTPSGRERHNIDRSL